MPSHLLWLVLLLTATAHPASHALLASGPTSLTGTAFTGEATFAEVRVERLRWPGTPWGASLRRSPVVALRSPGDAFVARPRAH